VETRLRLEPSDEYTHPLEDDPTFNESMYFNLFDPVAGVGGFFRLGNRANEGFAEMTVCLFLPGGRVGFMYGRPPISDNDSFDAAGLRFEVLEPFESLRVTYAGPLALLDDPLAMRDPKRAFAKAEQTECAVALDYRGLSPMLGGEASGPLADTELLARFARGHYEQHVGARGRIALADQEWELDGYGLRDHSWGPRSWQAPLWYRWLTCNAGPADGFMVSVIATREGPIRRSGVLFERGAYTPIADARIETEWSGQHHDQLSLRCLARTADRELEISGTVRSLIPLRHRRGSETTRIGEGLTEYRWDDKLGYGLSEYLDQLDDAGVPAGV
jgi:hypothetical protein